MLINRGPRRPHTGAHGGPTRWPTAAPRGGPRRSPRLINHHMVAIRERLRHYGFRVYVGGFRRGELHLGARRRLGAAATRTVNHKLILLSRRVRRPPRARALGRHAAAAAPLVPLAALRGQSAQMELRWP